jgi:hypothetical protein
MYLSCSTLMSTLDFALKFEPCKAIVSTDNLSYPRSSTRESEHSSVVLDETKPCAWPEYTDSDISSRRIIYSWTRATQVSGNSFRGVPSAADFGNIPKRRTELELIVDVLSSWPGPQRIDDRASELTEEYQRYTNITPIE